MAWSAPMTATTGNVFTAAQFNQYIRDNLLVTEGNIAAAPGSLLVATATNVVNYRTPDVAYLGTFESTTSTTYTDLGTVGPTITVTTGTKALLMIGAQVANTNAGLGSRVGVDISGATTTAAADANSYYAESGNNGDGFQGCWVTINNSLTGGSNTFKTQYRTTAGGGTSTFGHRLVAAVPF